MESMGRKPLLDRAEAPAVVSHPAGATSPSSSVRTELAIEVTSLSVSFLRRKWVQGEGRGPRYRGGWWCS